MDEINEIRKLVKDKQVVVGKERTLKALRHSELSKVYVCANCPALEKEDVTRFAEIAKTPIISLEIDNVELGDVCRRPHSIMMLGVRK